jgi:hypothetical protein
MFDQHGAADRAFTGAIDAGKDENEWSRCRTACWHQ